MPKAAIFDLDGTLLDSVDLHALAWHEAMKKFGHDVGFEQVRSQIGKGGDKLIPAFLSADEQRDHGKEMEDWRGARFKTKYHRWSAPSPRSPICFDACAMPAYELPSRPPPRRTNSASTSTSQLSPAWSTRLHLPRMQRNPNRHPTSFRSCSRS